MLVFNSKLNSNFSRSFIFDKKEQRHFLMSQRSAHAGTSYLSFSKGLQNNFSFVQFLTKYLPLLLIRKIQPQQITFMNQLSQNQCTNSVFQFFSNQYYSNLKSKFHDNYDKRLQVYMRKSSFSLFALLL